METMFARGLHVLLGHEGSLLGRMFIVFLVEFGVLCEGTEADGAIVIFFDRVGRELAEVVEVVRDHAFGEEETSTEASLEEEDSREEEDFEEKEEREELDRGQFEEGERDAFHEDGVEHLREDEGKVQSPKETVFLSDAVEVEDYLE
jgi:hypothetical protein